EDLRHFKRAIFGKPVIMGRKTWESIGRPLPGRTNIVITRDENFQAEGIKVVHSLQQAVDLADSIAFLDGVEEAMVMGGAEIYALALPLAQRLYLTQVHAEVEGDAWFPELDLSDWQEVARENYVADGPNPYDYSFIVYDRKS